jgi:DNA-binding NtrC family response regulator
VIRLLLVEDDALVGGTLVRHLARAYQVTWVTGVEAARDALAGPSFAVIVADYEVAEGEHDTLAVAAALQPAAVRILHSGWPDAPTRFADAVVVKPAPVKELLDTIERLRGSAS